jgi:hypothetical protein
MNQDKPERCDWENTIIRLNDKYDWENENKSVHMWDFTELVCIRFMQFISLYNKTSFLVQIKFITED